MLHRAATTAYSWWWASHIRTKQSKWLEQNLVDMEDRVQSMMKIIDQEGDSFAKRAEMYYRKRPELIESVEETYRAYRALAERYDHLSKDLQSANRTIAAVFPEQVQMAMESDDETSSLGSIVPLQGIPGDPKNFPKAPKFPKLPPQSLRGESIIASRKEQLKRSSSNAASMVSAITSGLTKEEAVKEIDALQKDILALQTEKEFLKSSYETNLAKFYEIEGKITDLQGRAYNLQDEFGIGTVIEDHEARGLMATTALTSCSQALNKLQGEQERSMKEVKAEYARIKEAHEKLEALKKQIQQGQVSQQQKGEPLAPKSLDLIPGSIEQQEGLDIDSLRKKIKEQLKLDCNAALTEPELADKIDDLVERIMDFETTVFTQNGLLKRLRQYIDELLQHIKYLEENKDIIAQSKDKTKRIIELEEELSKVKSLNQELVEQKNNFHAELMEAHCNLDHLKEKLDEVKPAEVVEDSGAEAIDEREAEVEVEPEKEVQHKEIGLTLIDKKGDDEEKQSIRPEGGEGAAVEMEGQDLVLEDKDGLSWRKLSANNIEERERILVEEYTVILRDYKDIKIKLSEAEKKNREHIFELASHARELRSTILAKDEENQILRRKLEELQGNPEEDVDLGFEKLSTPKADDQQQQQQEEEERTTSDDQPDTDKPQAPEAEPDRMPLFHHLYDPNTGIIARSMSVAESSRMDPLQESPHPASRLQARLRAELNDLLEGNLDFWLRFSTSFHHIQKFQATFKDLLLVLL